MKKIKLNKIMKEIIPDLSWHEYEYFSNHEILSNLNKNEIKIVEKELIKMIESFYDDNYLVAETLVHLKSTSAIKSLKFRLNSVTSSFERIKWAGFIFEIDEGESEMEQLAYDELLNLEFIYGIQGLIFYDLVKFKSERINKEIKKYAHHKYDIVQNSSKRALKHWNEK